ncbi:MAG: hypothetical protein HFI10_06035 [Lachnospiraceae bacterium]|jgi:hypothetical protein|nr:hypothetical protein [Lachnospiraceae bacterium]
MNLTNFLKQIDVLTSQYSTDQLIAFVHDIGRVCPEHCREGFLEMLKSAGGEAEKAANKKDIDFDEMYNHIRGNLKSIDSQEITITGVLNEEYDDWYDGSDEEFYYEDNSGISDMLEEACDFVHMCVDIERYREGFAVGKQMLEMEILCDNEYGDEEFSLWDLVHHELLHCNLKQAILDIAYCAYHAVPSSKRPEALYGVIVNAKEDTVTLEAMMQHGDEELSEFEEFLPTWVTYLGDKTGHDADRLIGEAVDLLNNVSLELQYAEKYADIHPGLYLNILENGKSVAVNDMVSIGLKAMKTIPKNYMMRSRAALKTAEFVIAADGEVALLEKCYFAACESDTSAQNYLRALLNGYGSGEKREELQRIFKVLPKDKSNGSYMGYEGNHFRYGSGTYFEREVNKPDSNMVLVLRFLDGQFVEVLDEGLNKSEALGWTGTFMKQGIALFLLYLHEGQWMDKGIAAMKERAKSAMQFSAEEYRKGTCGFEDIDENDLFCQLFLQWKSMVQMSSDIRNRAIKRIMALLEERTAGIMDANRRNYYGECAAYIAALGEVRESLGEMGAKQKLMTSYKEMYPRRSAFREEMRKYGWIDTRRK